MIKIGTRVMPARLAWQADRHPDVDDYAWTGAKDDHYPSVAVEDSL